MNVTAVATAVAQYLHGRGLVSYRPSGGWTSTETAVLFGRYVERPDRQVALNVAEPGIEHGATLQVRVRGKSGVMFDAGDLAAPIKAALHGLQNLDCGAGLVVYLISFTSATSLGYDANGRQDYSLNFLLSTSDPSSSLVDLV